jgi:CrcB protein
VIVLAVAVAGAIGAPLRYVVERAASSVRPGPFPFGTFVVNVTGSLALGVVIGLAAAGSLDADARTIVGTGFLGGYTTFSTYAYETVRRAEDGHLRTSLAYAVASVLAGGCAAALGLALTGGL